MNDETAIIQSPGGGLASVSALADEFSKATRLTRYQEGLRDETIRRQKTDLVTFARFLEGVHVAPGDFCNDLNAWAGIGAGLLEAFIQWQKLQGYSIGTINVRLATVKAYCHLAYEVGILDLDTHTQIQGVKGIQGLSPHDCRHSWATRAASHGTPLDRLKQAGEWSNIQTPLRYIKDSAIANKGVIVE